MSKWFFKDPTRIHNGHQRSTLLLKFKMAALNKFHNFFGKKTEKLIAVIIHILQSHYPPSGNVQVVLVFTEI